MTIVYERWETAGDDRVCALCWARDGAVFEQGKGPQPPLHRKCRCRRVFAYTIEPPPSLIDPAPAPAPAAPPAAEPAPAPAPAPYALPAPLPAPQPWPLPIPLPPVIIWPPDDDEKEKQP